MAQQPDSIPNQIDVRLVDGCLGKDCVNKNCRNKNCHNYIVVKPLIKRPHVVETYPCNNQNDVKITESIRTTFDMDLDSRYLQEFVYLMDDDGVKVEGRITYRKKALTFTPLQPLQKGKSYTFFLVGDRDLDDNKVEGIRSITNVPMGGKYIISFDTELGEILPPPKVVSPVHGTILRESPIYQWETIDGAKGYEVQVSTTNTFNTKLFPINDEETIISGTSFEPNTELEDGIYYWRIRTIRSDGDIGIWSRIYQFHLKTTEEGTISTDDPQIPDVAEQLFGESMELEIVEAFPKESALQVPRNVKSIYFRLIGDLDTSNLDLDSISLVGKHISDDYQEESHGIVKGRTTVVESSDGTTYIVFTPELLPTEDLEDGEN